MTYSITSTAMPAIVVQPATCPDWCNVDHTEDGPAHGNFDSAPIEVREVASGAHTVVCVDISQDPGGEPRIMLVGPTLDMGFPAADAVRIAHAILARAALVEGTK